MRDETGDLWPTFYVSGPVGNGTANGNGTGAFTLLGSKTELGASPNQTSRLGGQL